MELPHTEMMKESYAHLSMASLELIILPKAHSQAGFVVKATKESGLCTSTPQKLMKCVRSGGDLWQRVMLSNLSFPAS